MAADLPPFLVREAYRWERAEIFEFLQNATIADNCCHPLTDQAIEDLQELWSKFLEPFRSKNTIVRPKGGDLAPITVNMHGLNVPIYKTRCAIAAVLSTNLPTTGSVLSSQPKRSSLLSGQPGCQGFE
ncbi:hypothetical protein FN846DRAFT_910108 [Sphaerosporella brunnea]|uniref:Uncharacterized protein n=1 Tax=Sphaerosporella brunnea TaxID=1250544 RepID=A0A5J5EPA2_9PEZI|nr:hypothetical protein FN846DRAFT_910108 [Sphaerosporella brunnea]